MVEAGEVPVALPAALTSSKAPVPKEQVVDEVLAQTGARGLRAGCRAPFCD